MARIGARLRGAWAVWRGLSARHRSYAVYGLLAPPIALAAMLYTLDLGGAECLRAAVRSEASDTLVNLSSDRCDSEPFASVATAFTVERVPEYDDTLGVTRATARAWTVIFAGLIAGTLASSIAGTAMTVVMTSKDAKGKDARGKGWGIGAALAAAGVLLALGLTSSASSAVFQTDFMNEDGEEVLVDYGELFGSISTWSFAIAGLGGAVMTAGIVAVGVEIDRRNRESFGTEESFRTEDIEAYRRASTTANLILAALAVSLSFGVLSTGARIRLMEHIPGVGDIPGLLSILYGIVFSIAIAALYVPTQTRLGYTRERLIEAYGGGELGPKTEAEVLSKRKSFRDELDQTSGMASTTTGALTVLGPLLSAAVSTVVA